MKWIWLERYLSCRIIHKKCPLKLCVFSFYLLTNTVPHLVENPMLDSTSGVKPHNFEVYLCESLCSTFKAFSQPFFHFIPNPFRAHSPIPKAKCPFAPKALQQNYKAHKLLNKFPRVILFVPKCKGTAFLLTGYTTLDFSRLQLYIPISDIQNYEVIFPPQLSLHVLS